MDNNSNITTCCCLIFPIVNYALLPRVSPNGNGINDTWNIKYPSTYTDCTVDIFNRYRQKLFSSVGYASPWDGKYNHSDLPIGIYYYVINPKHGRNVMSGTVTIVR